MKAEISIRKLGFDDLSQFRLLRLESLKNEPKSFASSWEEESAQENSFYRDRFKAHNERNFILGAWINEELVGIIGTYKEGHLKTAHKNGIWGMYVKPEFRRKGIARNLLVELLFDLSKTEVTQVHLGVVSSNIEAIELYNSLDFQTYGVEPSALIVDGVECDELLMVKFIDLHKA